MPAQAGIYGAIFIAPYKAITSSLAFARDDKVNSKQSTDNSLMLPRLLRRGYRAYALTMTLVKRDLAKALCILLFLSLHLKVKAIKKDIHVCVRSQTDISGGHTGLPLHKKRKSSLVSTRDDNNQPPLSPRGGNGFAPPFNKKRKYILPLASPTGRFGGAQSNLLFTSSFSVTPSIGGGRGRWLILYIT
ncbi:hypothetical protein D0T66_09345 [Dysgonomonas sp. 25]|nr:hypothetical protein [Dysgonomonas sp. 25]